MLKSHYWILNEHIKLTKLIKITFNWKLSKFLSKPQIFVLIYIISFHDNYDLNRISCIRHFIDCIIWRVSTRLSEHGFDRGEIFMRPACCQFKWKFHCQNLALEMTCFPRDTWGHFMTNLHSQWLCGTENKVVYWARENVIIFKPNRTEIIT